MIPIHLLILSIALCMGNASLPDDVCDASGTNLHVSAEPAIGHSLLQTRSKQDDQLNLSQKQVRTDSTWDASQLFYQFHLPKTGGTTIANLLYADICTPYKPEMEILTYHDACSKPCPHGHTDNEFSCSLDGGRMNFIHAEFRTQVARAEYVKNEVGASEIVFVTALRRGSDRLVSEWAMELHSKTWQPPSGVELWSNESLRAYLQDDNGQDHWLKDKHASYRSNKQVKMLASVQENNPTRDVDEDDLELAKTVLTEGRWVIGFTDCLNKLHEKLEDIAARMYPPGTLHKQMPDKSHLPFSSTGDFNLMSLDSETLALLYNKTALDNALYEWAKTQAIKGHDSRWTAPCHASQWSDIKVALMS